MNGSTCLPYVVGELSADVYDPRLLSLSSRDVQRCIQAFEWFITSHADMMIARCVDDEVARYEDLMYRCMGVSDEDMPLHAESRRADRNGSL